MTARKVRDPSLPIADPQWERFAQLMAMGNTTPKMAYKEVGFTSDRSNAARLTNKPAVRARIEWLQRQASDKATSTLAAGIQHEQATRAWVTDKLVHNARVCMGELPVRRRVKVKGQTVTQEEYVHRPSAANKALQLLGADQGMFKTESAPPPPEENAGAKTVNDPKIVQQLERYRKKGLAVIAGKDVKKGRGK